MTDTPARRNGIPRRASFDDADFDDADFGGTDVDADGSGDTGRAIHRCDRCGRPFEREAWLALHLGHAHPEALSEEEIERFRDVHEREEADLDRFRLLALGALVLLYFGLLLVYAILAL